MVVEVIEEVEEAEDPVVEEVGDVEHESVEA